MKDPKYCLVCDVCGFKNININIRSNELIRRVADWTEFTKGLADDFEIDIKICSDTLFAVADNSKNDLRNLLGFSKRLLEVGIARSFPLRGGISFGKVYVSDHSLFGPAAIAAYNLSNKQDWFRISCDFSEDSTVFKHLDGIWDWDALFMYSVPFREGEIVSLPIVSWQVPNLNDLMTYTVGKGLMNSKAAIKWNEWGHKFQNTLIFSIYSKIMKKSAKDPKTFYGIIPMEAIDLYLDISRPENKAKFNKLLDKRIPLNLFSYEKKLKEINNELKINEGDANLLINKGENLINLLRYREAITTLNKALKLNPSLADAWNKKGEAQLWIGEYDKSIESINKALEINPQLAEAWNNMGVAMFYKGKYDESIKCFKKALEFDPKNETSLENLGYSLRANGREDDSEKIYEALWKL